MDSHDPIIREKGGLTDTMVSGHLAGLLKAGTPTNAFVSAASHGLVI